jgi:hypothetical protein
MGALEQIIEQAILKLSGKSQLKQVLSGVAKDVGELTCTVERQDAPSLYDVRLNAIDDDLESCFTVYPAEGSEVLVAIIENMKTEAVVIRCSEVQKVKAKIGTTELEIDADGFRFGRSNEDLKAAMGDLVAEIQKIIVVQGTGPNVAALTGIKNRIDQILK